MAKEKIIEIKTGDAIKNVQDLKNNISAYKDKLKDLEIGTKAYQETLVSLQQNQAALRNAMYGTTASIQEVQKAATGLTSDFSDMDKVVAETTDKLNDQTTSYNEYVRVLAQLKEAWRSATDANDRAKLGDAIESVNTKLKDMDKSVGVFGRNVGNYIGAVDHLTAGLSAMGTGAAGLAGPLKAATTGFRTLSATPAVAILGILADVLQKIITELKGSEESTNKMTAAMAPFAAIGDVVTKVMQALGKSLANVVGYLSTLLQKIFPKLRQEAELRKQITEEEIALSYEAREAVEKNADAELKIAQLRNAAADKTNKSARERIALLNEAKDLELEISRRNVDIATKEYEIAVLRAKTAENSKEANDALAQAYAKKVKAETDYYNNTVRLQAQISAAQKEERQNAEKAEKEEIRARMRMIQVNKEYWEIRLQTAVKGSEDEFTTKQAILDDEELLAKEKAKAEIENADEREKTIENIERNYFLKRLALVDEFSDAQMEEEKLILENRMNEQQEGSLEYLAAAVELKKFELDTLHQAETESNEAFRAREIQAQKDYEGAQKNLIQGRISMFQSYAGAVSGVLDGIADLYEEDAKNNKEAAERVKNLRIASATIEMISGAVGAYSQAAGTIPPPYGIILGAINATAVTAAGIANIIKIKNTKISTSGASTTAPVVPAQVSAPTIQPEVNQVRTVTSATEEDRLNQMASPQRVYILESDLEASENQRRVEVTETTF